MGVILPSTTGALISSAVGMAMSLIPYKKNLFDLSAQGTTVSVKGQFGGAPIQCPLITKFADDREAITITPIEVNDATSSYNGKIIAVGKIPLYRVSISLIPHSPNDISLSNLVNESMAQTWWSGVARKRGQIELIIDQIRIDEQAASFQLLGIGGAKQGLAKAYFDYGVLLNSSAIGNSLNVKHGAETSVTRDGRQTASVYEFIFSRAGMMMV